jgi:hypothetical protein
MRTRSMPVFDRFMPTVTRPLPAGYMLSGRDTTALRLLRLHGIAVVRYTGITLGNRRAFIIDSLQRSARSFQGHNEVRLAGQWVSGASVSVEDPYVVWLTGRDGARVMYLLDPESDDGFATWNAFDAAMGVGKAYPILRLPTNPTPVLR